MKKKTVVFIISLLVLIIISVTSLVIYKNTNTKDQFQISKTKESADISFAVLSDIHNNDSNFQDAINDLHNINSNLDALILNGDSVDQGLDEQYDNIKNVLSKNEDKLPDKIIKNIGNHEYYNYSEDINTEAGVKDLINKYLDFSGEDKIYHDTWIKGYHFISLGSDDTGVDKINYTSACVSDEQINWLKETIKDKYEKGRPIFVFFHQPIDMNFFNLDVSGVDKNDEIKNILKEYPEVVLFSSHTHITPDKEVDDSKDIIMVNTGSVNSNYVTDEKDERGFSENKSLSNGIYVEVKENKVNIKAMNFKNNIYIYERELF